MRIIDEDRRLIPPPDEFEAARSAFELLQRSENFLRRPAGRQDEGRRDERVLN